MIYYEHVGDMPEMDMITCNLNYVKVNIRWKMLPTTGEFITFSGYYLPILKPRWRVSPETYRDVEFGRASVTYKWPACTALLMRTKQDLTAGLKSLTKIGKNARPGKMDQ